jgi:hypothetical protein
MSLLLRGMINVVIQRLKESVAVPLGLQDRPVFASLLV